MVPAANLHGEVGGRETAGGGPQCCQNTFNCPQVTELVRLEGSPDIWFPGEKLFVGADDKQ